MQIIQNKYYIKLCLWHIIKIGKLESTVMAMLVLIWHWMFMNKFKNKIQNHNFVIEYNTQQFVINNTYNV